MRDLVIFLPGIGGSTLLRDGRPLWGLSAGAVAGALFGGGLDRLAVAAEAPDEDLGDGITIGELLNDVHLIPGLWKIDGYDGFLRALEARMALRRGENLRTFPYDWRRDNRVSARRLARLAATALAAWRARSGAADARLILVAHSMGGLVARYFVEVLGGWRDVRQLITLGTPFRGSLNAAGFLVNGFARRIGPLRLDATAPLRSFASVHQLLPTYACVDPGDGGAPVQVGDAGLAGLDPAKIADARAFHREIEDAAAVNARDPAYVAVPISPVLSSMQPTFQSLRRTADGVVLVGMRKGRDEGGDGTVPMVSAIPPGMKASQGFYVEGIHGSLQATDPVAEFVTGQLRASAVDLDRLRSGTGAAGVIRFALDDAYAAGTPVPLRAEIARATEQRLRATAVNTGTNETVATTLWPRAGVFEGQLTLPPGAWRVMLAGERSPPVTDLTLSIGEGAD